MDRGIYWVTVRYYSFHNEVFSKLLLFVWAHLWILLLVGVCKGTWWIQGDREMSGAGEHEVKLTDNKTLKTGCVCNPEKRDFREHLLPRLYDKFKFIFWQ